MGGFWSPCLGLIGTGMSNATVRTLGPQKFEHLLLPMRDHEMRHLHAQLPFEHHFSKCRQPSLAQRFLQGPQLASNLPAQHRWRLLCCLQRPA